MKINAKKIKLKQPAKSNFVDMKKEISLPNNFDSGYLPVIIGTVLIVAGLVIHYFSKIKETENLKSELAVIMMDWESMYQDRKNELGDLAAIDEEELLDFKDEAARKKGYENWKDFNARGNRLVGPREMSNLIMDSTYKIILDVE